MDDDADEDEQLSVENFSASAVSETKRRHSARPMSAYFPSEKTKLEETVYSLGALEEGESRAQSMQPSMTNGVDGDQPTAKDTVDSENGKPQSNASIFELKRCKSHKI